ncbi:hypothetical protein [Vagococcus fluvialis]|uniref:hypothetical protein n=1 Tax=Vagococcus fluvialis TaxID=2738 RepID=UPI0037AF584D
MKTLTVLNVQEMKQINGGASSPYAEPWRTPGGGKNATIKDFKCLAGALGTLSGVAKLGILQCF